MTNSEEEAIQSLLARIEAIEKSSWSHSNSTTSKNNEEDIKITTEMTRARKHVQSTRCYSSQWKLCPSNYYTLSLDERKVILGADNTSQLCKACLFENKNY